jgi:hypothetical protein
VRIRLGLSALTAACLVMAACGGGDSGDTVKADYTDFCLLAAELNAETEAAGAFSSGTIGNPEELKKVMDSLTDLSERLLLAAPEPATASLEVLVDVVRKRNELFAVYQYQLSEIAADSTARLRLEEITANPAVAEASDDFASFMEDACNFERP